MASFSRGLPAQWHFFTLRQTQLSSCKCTPPPLQTRFFTTSLRLLKKAPKPKVPTPPAPRPSLLVKPTQSVPKPSISPLLASTRAPASSYANIIAQKPRTLLYESPSHLWFRTGCFASGMFCISYSVYHYWTIQLHPPEGLAWWIPHAYGVICLAMAAMATYFIMGTGRIIKTITAVSSSSSSLVKAAAKPSGQGPLYIEVTTQRMFPFLKPKKKLYMPHEIELPFRMSSMFEYNKRIGVAVEEPLSVAEQVRRQRAAIEAAKKEREYTMNHLLTAPFRDAKKAFKGVWPGIVRSFSREGFTKIVVGGVTYKLDTTGGWALDDGRAMDRLLPIRPNSVNP
ncbi:uncharacterized protein PODANS_7_9510 [Podospora anserina S mat+]|uniref:Podospora anserina S mat+ genomic DNA chromosome 7, supercontig 1 n=1 Tax=Podospora anserina (strain S / ATCC MYA-4624 / DSM 980 / FGSC 10383) TaxID=515849 RepID=B2AX69_PODAN|nr:uncharacterized protein PODANS_7_9510 [Podospora anserina S mat+]CAP68993.1 unnamed protein product [Podospora anserina S mat+]CDP32469.1 Putative protein of unknown function [Podospora anserina S mat+]